MLTLIYLHGFNSAFDPAGSKVRQLAALAPVGEVVGFNVAYHESDALERLDDRIRDVAGRSDARLVLVGTSLGGFYARHLGHRHRHPIVTINPSLQPWITLRRALGATQQNFKTGERYTIDESVVNGLQALAVPKLSVPALTVIAEDDELLQFDRATIDLLRSESQVVLTHGGHRLESLPAEALSAIERFLRDIATSKST
jgi:predicted esterase YcpF (UPF0227 family)